MSFFELSFVVDLSDEMLHSFCLPQWSRLLYQTAGSLLQRIVMCEQFDKCNLEKKFIALNNIYKNPQIKY